LDEKGKVMEERIYLDNGASTKTDPRVVEEMLPYFTRHFGNPSSMHSYGRETKDAITKAREGIGSYIGASPEEVIFTSGGTESNNFALKGIAYANKDKGKHIIVSSIEHDCVMNSAKWLSSQGFEVTYLPVDSNGLVDPSAVESAMREDTILVSVMHANNEVGTIEPIGEIGRICRKRGVYFHTDACQSFCKVPIDLDMQSVDLMTINAHKIYGPKGVGALYVRNGVNIMPWQHGGGHEFGMRSSTENVPGIIGFAKAVELCYAEFGTETKRLANLRDRIIDTISERIPNAYLNGHRTERLPNNVNFGFHGLEGEAIKIMLELDERGIAVSTGSACSSNQSGGTPSHVLVAMGLNAIEARGALRVTLGRFNTDQEVTKFIEALPKVVGSLRSITSMR
jgi:cysteine desulfurase